MYMCVCVFVCVYVFCVRLCITTTHTHTYTHTRFQVNHPNVSDNGLGSVLGLHVYVMSIGGLD